MVNRSIENMSLEKNQIGDKGARALGDALAVNRSLKALDLYENKIGCDGGVALAEGIQVNTSLEKLELCGVRIGGGGVAFGTAIERNKTLKKLIWATTESLS
eukprot:GHVN01025163.1.p2 GENE.GHVN01025163.1~~GHVN01025163.1.p2  ORF type:complete len:102 (-),score=21.59 GHVN01025163.1:862-1167(-)